MFMATKVKIFVELTKNDTQIKPIVVFVSKQPLKMIEVAPLKVVYENHREEMRDETFDFAYGMLVTKLEEFEEVEEASEEGGKHE